MIKDLKKLQKEKLSHSLKQKYDFEDVGNVFPDNKEFINILKRKLIREKFITIEDE
ncbi:MAG: hypothetical protein ACQERB_17625 [Promethearchaeati archaeon]